MKIFFNTLVPLKKEVAKFRNAYQKTFNKKINLQETQDLVSRMYGWQHYNDMSRSHTEMYSMKNINLLDQDELIKHDIHFIDKIDNSNKIRLEIIKRNVILSYFEDNDNEDKMQFLFLNEFFNKKTFMQKLLEGNKSNKIDSLFDIPQDSWRKNCTIYGNNKQKLSEIYSGVPVLNAISRGGLFVLRESLATNTIKVISDSLSPEEQHRLKIIDLNNSFANNDYSRSIDLKKDESIKSIFEYLMTMITNRDLDGNGMWIGRCSILMRNYSIALENIYGKGDGALTNVELINLMTTDKIIDIAFNQLEHIKNVENLRNTIRQIPGFDEKNYMYHNTVSQIVYEQMGYLLMQVTTLIKNIDSFHHNKVESIKISDLVNSKDIIVVIFNEERKYVNSITAILALYRKGLSNIIGTSLQSYDSSSLIKKVRSNRFKPIVLDCMESYFVKGFSIVMVQAKSAGYALFGNISDTDRARHRCPEEFASFIANTANNVVVKGAHSTSDIFNDIEANVTSFYSNSGEKDKPSKNNIPIKEIEMGKIVYFHLGFHSLSCIDDNVTNEIDYLIVK